MFVNIFALVCIVLFFIRSVSEIHVGCELLLSPSCRVLAFFGGVLPMFSFVDMFFSSKKCFRQVFAFGFHFRGRALVLFLFVAVLRSSVSFCIWFFWSVGGNKSVRCAPTNFQNSEYSNFHMWLFLYWENEKVLCFLFLCVCRRPSPVFRIILFFLEPVYQIPCSGANFCFCRLVVVLCFSVVFLAKCSLTYMHFCPQACFNFVCQALPFEIHFRERALVCGVLLRFCGFWWRLCICFCLLVWLSLLKALEMFFSCQVGAFWVHNLRFLVWFSLSLSPFLFIFSFFLLGVRPFFFFLVVPPGLQRQDGALEPCVCVFFFLFFWVGTPFSSFIFCFFPLFCMHLRFLAPSLARVCARVCVRVPCAHAVRCVREGARRGNREACVHAWVCVCVSLCVCVCLRLRSHICVCVCVCVWSRACGGGAQPRPRRAPGQRSCVVYCLAQVSVMLRNFVLEDSLL